MPYKDKSKQAAALSLKEAATTEKVKAGRTAWNKANPEKLAEYHRNWRRARSAEMFQLRELAAADRQLRQELGAQRKELETTRAFAQVGADAWCELEAARTEIKRLNVVLHGYRCPAQAGAQCAICEVRP